MSQHSHTPSITLPSMPNPIHSSTSFSRTTSQRLSRPGSLAPWDAFDDESDFGPIHDIVLPIQLEDDAEGVNVQPTPRWRQAVVGWRSGLPGPDCTSPTASTYTSVYPLSSSHSFSRSSFIDSEAPLSRGSVAYSDQLSDSDTFGAQRTQDWAPWLSNPPPSNNRRSHMLNDTLSPSLLHTTRSRPGPRRPILKTSQTFYLPPLYTDQRPTFAAPRRPPLPSPRASTSTLSTSQPPKTRDGCFSSCIARNKAAPRDHDKDKTPPARRPFIAARGKHYRVSFVQDRQWRANILNQAVEESLTQTIFPMSPKPCRSKYAPRSTLTHRTQGIPDNEPPSTNRSTEHAPTPVACRRHHHEEGLSFSRTDKTTTGIMRTVTEESKPESGPDLEPEPGAGKINESAQVDEANDDPRGFEGPLMRNAPSPGVCSSLRDIYMLTEEAMERLTQYPPSPTTATVLPVR